MLGSWHPLIPAGLSSRWTDHGEITECSSPEFRTSPISWLFFSSGHSSHLPEPSSLHQSNRKTENRIKPKQKTVPACSPCKVNSRLVQWYLPLNMLKIKIITFLPKVVLPKAPRMAMLSIYMGLNQPHSGDQCRLSVSLPLPSTEMKYPFRLSCPSPLLSFHLHGLSSGLSISGCLLLFDLPASSLNLLGTLAARVLPTNYRS